jgi:hypothetical protein
MARQLHHASPLPLLLSCSRQLKAAPASLVCMHIDAAMLPPPPASHLRRHSRCLFEDGQRLQALADVRGLESKHQEQRRAEGSSPLQNVISAAGQACMPAVAGSGNRAPPEVFWACPSTTVAQFLKQVAAAVASKGKQPGAAAADLAAVAQLSKAVQVALGGAMQRRAHQQQWHGAALNAAVAGLDEPEWTAGADVRAALEALADACCRCATVRSSQCCYCGAARGMHQACGADVNALLLWPPPPALPCPVLQAALPAAARGASSAPGQRAPAV